MKKLINKLLAVVSVIFIAIPCFTISACAANTADDVIAVAANEIGYKQSSNGYTKYGDYTGYPNSAWCQSFVAWVANEAGVPSSVIKRYASCTLEVKFFKEIDRWEDSSYCGGYYTPQKGDLIFFRWANHSKIDHVGFVEYVENGKVHTIEGNTSYKVARRTYSLSSKYIVGYGLPEYDESTCLTAPKLNISVDGQNVTFSWNKVKNATHYDLRIYYADGRSYLNNWGGDPNETELQFNMEPGNYTAQVCSSNKEDGSFVYCNSIPFTVESKQLVSPNVNVSVDGQIVTFSWNKVDGASYYDLRLYYADGRSLYDHWGGDPNETELKFKMDPGDYSVQVCSAKGNGNYVYCNAIYFTVNVPDSTFENYSSVYVTEGTYYLSPMCAPNSCIDSEGGETLNDNYNHNIHLWEYLGNSNQQFEITYAGEKDGNQLYYIKNTLTNQYLSADGKNVTEIPYKISSSKWYFVDCGNGYYKIINSFNNLALDIYNGSSENGTNAWCYDPSDMNNPAQLFLLNSVN